MRKIFFYEKDGVSQVENFFSDTDEKIRSKLKFQLAYLQDKNNQFVQPHVKHFSIEKYRRTIVPFFSTINILTINFVANSGFGNTIF